MPHKCGKCRRKPWKCNRSTKKCSCERDLNCNHTLLKLFKKNLSLRKKASKKQLKKAGGICVPCCQNGPIQECDVSGCTSDFYPYALINRLGPLRPGDRRSICCCLRKQNKILKRKCKQLKPGCYHLSGDGTGDYEVQKVGKCEYYIVDNLEFSTTKGTRINSEKLYGTWKSKKKFILRQGSEKYVFVWIAPGNCNGNSSKQDRGFGPFAS